MRLTVPWWVVMCLDILFSCSRKKHRGVSYIILLKEVLSRIVVQSRSTWVQFWCATEGIVRHVVCLNMSVLVRKNLVWLVGCAFMYLLQCRHRKYDWGLTRVIAVCRNQSAVLTEMLLSDSCSRSNRESNIRTYWNSNRLKNFGLPLRLYGSLNFKNNRFFVCIHQEHNPHRWVEQGGSHVWKRLVDSGAVPVISIGKHSEQLVTIECSWPRGKAAVHNFFIFKTRCYKATVCGCFTRDARGHVFPWK